MSALKITAADRWFSLCIRKRAGWRCQRCNTDYGGPSRALHCSHFHGRGNHAVRHDPRNALSLCYGCHRLLSAHPSLHADLIAQILGPYNAQALEERAQDTAHGRLVKRSLPEIAAHYRAEYERMSPGSPFTPWL